MTADSISDLLRKYWVAMCAVIAPLLLLLLFNENNSRWLSGQLAAAGLPVRWRSVDLALFAAEILLVVLVIFALNRLLLPRCPHCRTTFTPGRAGAVIATRRCPKCGAIVIADSSQADSRVRTGRG